MNLVLAEYVNNNKYDAGNKARKDVVTIACQNGFSHIPLYKSGNNKVSIILSIASALFTVVVKIKKGEVILLQYPYAPNLVNRFLFSALYVVKKIKKCKLELIIHDIKGLRSDKLGTASGKKELELEVQRFNIFDKVILHNEQMQKKLLDTGLKAPNEILGIFDYIYDGDRAKISKTNTIIIAGNLSFEKCKYIYRLNELAPLHFSLYGIGYANKNIDNVTYNGKFSPDELIDHLKGKYGLVWDGDSLETCTGAYGEYLKYNNPHKLSLYIAAGLPVIVWNQSALAKYVKEKGVGVVVSSLRNLNEELGTIDDKKYKMMKDSVEKERTDIIKGEHLRRLITH